MMKKYIFLTILLLFTLPLVVHADEDKNINDLQLKKPIEIVSKDETKSYENMNIDVQVNKDGYYSLMSNTEIHYSDEEIDYISLDEPILLSFQLSSQRNGGIWLLDKNEGEQMIKDLTEIKDELKKQGNNDQLTKIENIIEYLTSTGPITDAST